VLENLLGTSAWRSICELGENYLLKSHSDNNSAPEHQSREFLAKEIDLINNGIPAVSNTSIVQFFLENLTDLKKRVDFLIYYIALRDEDLSKTVAEQEMEQRNAWPSGFINYDIIVDSSIYKHVLNFFRRGYSDEADIQSAIMLELLLGESARWIEACDAPEAEKKDMRKVYRFHLNALTNDYFVTTVFRLSRFARTIDKILLYQTVPNRQYMLYGYLEKESQFMDSATNWDNLHNSKTPMLEIACTESNLELVKVVLKYIKAPPSTNRAAHFIGTSAAFLRHTYTRMIFNSLYWVDKVYNAAPFDEKQKNIEIFYSLLIHPEISSCLDEMYNVHVKVKEDSFVFSRRYDYILTIACYKNDVKLLRSLIKIMLKHPYYQYQTANILSSGFTKDNEKVALITKTIIRTIAYSINYEATNFDSLKPLLGLLRKLHGNDLAVTDYLVEAACLASDPQDFAFDQIVLKKRLDEYLALDPKVKAAYERRIRKTPDLQLPSEVQIEEVPIDEVLEDGPTPDEKMAISKGEYLPPSSVTTGDKMISQRRCCAYSNIPD
jgi:hypothetical protein